MYGEFAHQKSKRTDLENIFFSFCYFQTENHQLYSMRWFSLFFHFKVVIYFHFPRLVFCFQQPRKCLENGRNMILNWFHFDQLKTVDFVPLGFVIENVPHRTFYRDYFCSFSKQPTCSSQFFFFFILQNCFQCNCSHDTIEFYINF